jgi:fatty-acid peroxygenase
LLRPRAADAIPHLGLDSTLSLYRQGYSFISSQCDAHGVDAFRTRVMLTPVVCMRGREAAEFFYGKARFRRAGAMPVSVLKLLQDRGSVQMLEGEAHRVRKAMFMAMMAPPALESAVSLFRDRFLAYAENADGVVRFHDAARRILAETALAWAGLPDAAVDLDRRVEEFGAMLEGSARIGPANWRARRLRNRSEAWAQNVIAAVRSGALVVAADSPLGLIAGHYDADGRPLDEESAAVELLNVLRPITAVDRYVVFAATGLAARPDWAERLRAGDEKDLNAFALEVRRFYPFFPMIGGRAIGPLQWKDHEFADGDWVLLDLHGTNHDPRLWPEPDQFRPERFLDWRGDAYAYAPQGAGGYETGHRCPGENLTIALVEETARLLVSETRYTLPPQDLSIDLAELPALPKSGLVMQGLRRA